MDCNEKKLLNDMLKDATTNEEKKELIFEWMKEKRKNTITKQLMTTLGVVTSGALTLLIMLFCKEIFKK